MKITRDGKSRMFTFSMGCQGVLKAHDIQKYSFKCISTWADANDHAKGHLAVFGERLNPDVSNILEHEDFVVIDKEWLESDE